MAQRTKPPFRADHVGSLLRPKTLLDAREKWKTGALSQAALAKLEDAAIRDAVRTQEAVGLQGITDGEMRRDSWHMDFMLSFEGMRPTDDPVAVPFSHGVDYANHRAVVHGKIRYPERGIMREHFAFLKTATRRTAKFTVPAPTMYYHSILGKLYDAKTYPDADMLWSDLAAGYNAFVKDFAALGCTYLQLDDVFTATLCDPKTRARVKSMGGDADAALALFIDAINAAVAGRPKDMAITVHMCRGNYMSEYMTEGGYDAIAERYLAETDVDGFFMEYDDERSGDFKPLRFLPKGKLAVLGIVTSKFGKLESKDELKRRIEDASRYAAIEQLCLSPQCGFASTHHGNKVSADDQRRKLARIVEVAEEVWG